MDSLLKGIFGGDDDGNRRQNVQDYINRYEDGPVEEGYSDEEAYSHYQQVAQHADPDTIQQAALQAFGRMSPDQRAEFARMIQQQTGGQLGGGHTDDPRQLAGMVAQVHRQDPGGLASLFGVGGGGGGRTGGGMGNMLGSVLGGGGIAGGSIGKIALGGIAAYAMKQMMGGGNDTSSRRRIG